MSRSGIQADVVAGTTSPFLVRLADESLGGVCRLGVPVLGGRPAETIFPPAQPAGLSGEFTLFRSGDLLLGCASRAAGEGELEAVTERLYRDLLSAARGRHLCRIWNYVPEINLEVGGLENYRAFCRARSLAFDAEFGRDSFGHLSAASAVGAADGRLTVVFAATDTAPAHWENPEQVSAYRYPAEHGPKAPSFARATVTADRRYAFVSGTSSIKGHATVAPGDTAGQVECTLDNLAIISRTIGLGDDLGAGSRRWTRHFKIYLRHGSDLPAVSTRLGDSLLRADDRVTWLQADICRAELNVEIEATLVAV